MAGTAPSRRKLTAATFEERIHLVRNCSAGRVRELCLHHLGPSDYAALPHDYINSLSPGDQTLSLRAILMGWTASKKHMVAREMQLRAILADAHGQHTIVSAGTGSGKTFPTAISILLDDPEKKSITITVSPLRRLQATQVDDFNTELGILTLAINEDTPRDASWWAANIFAPGGVEAPVRHLIVTVEQLFKTPEGHMPRLGEWLRTKAPFQRLVTRIIIDEAHFIYTAGQPLYGLPAFRPAWGLLDHLKRQLPSKIHWHLYSATLPPHILLHIKQKLLPGGDFVFIHLTSNRPNIMYATHKVVGQIDNLVNYRCFLPLPFTLDAQPRTLIFVDDKKLAGRIQKYLRGCLPISLQSHGIVRHYHSSMSQLYLEQTHEAFVSPSGSCRLLIATSGQSVGVDFPNVKIVCTVGLPSNIVDSLQRGGRAQRTGNESALHIMFVDPWIYDVDQAEYGEFAQQFLNDPDRPRAELRTAAQRRERAPLSLVHVLQSETCLRALFAQYLNDMTPTALSYSAPFCCERHNDGFDVNQLLPSPLHVETTSGTKRTSDTSTRLKYRPKADRIKLEELLIDWLCLFLRNDKLFRSTSDVLSTEKRKELAHIPARDITCALDITRRLDETEEWGAEFADLLFRLITDHDEANKARADQKAREKKKNATQNRSRSQIQRRLTETGGFVNSTAENYMTDNSGPSKKRKT